MDEQTVVTELVSGWVKLGVTYAGDAPGVTALYVYVSSERGSVFPEIYFEQNGKVVHPSKLEGTDASSDRVGRMHRLQFEDLQAAEKKLDELGVPRPTEYRVYFEPATGKLDVQLSRELIYAHDPDKMPQFGIVDWIGDRAPRSF